MTSSLVGSEMCIRDSVKEHHRSRGSETLNWLRTTTTTTTSTTAAAAATTVSYTHLTLPTICSV
eukprot:6331907-Prorocentrum_lima.AAC.1